jgi:hypothetical protein
MRASLYTGSDLTDMTNRAAGFQSGTFAVGTELPDDLVLTPTTTIKVLLDGLAYAEIPIEYDRTAGESKLSICRHGNPFLKVMMNATRKYRPALFYCTLGIPFLTVDLLVNSLSAPRAGNVKP